MRAFSVHAAVSSHLKSRALSRADHGSSLGQRFMVLSPKPRTLVSWCTFTFLQLKFCEETVNVSFWYACSSLFTPQEQSIVILSIAQQAICRTVVFPDNHRRLCYAWTVWVIPISPIPSSHVQNCSKNVGQFHDQMLLRFLGFPGEGLASIPLRSPSPSCDFLFVFFKLVQELVVFPSFHCRTFQSPLTLPQSSKHLLRFVCISSSIGTSVVNCSRFRDWFLSQCCSPFQNLLQLSGV